MAEYEDPEEEREQRRRSILRKSIAPTLSKTDLPSEPEDNAPKDEEDSYAKRIRRFFGGKKGTGAAGKKKKEGAEAQAEALSGK